MITKKILFLVAFVLTSFVAFAGAQTPSKSNPAYDAELARKLGADDMGMKWYVLVILKTGPQDAAVTGEARKKAFEGHFANINKLAEERKLAVAGPFKTNDKTYRGLYVMNTSSLDEARKWTEADPSVLAGIFVPDYFPWYGSAALMATNEIHKTVTKTQE